MVIKSLLITITRHGLSSLAGTSSGPRGQNALASKGLFLVAMSLAGCSSAAPPSSISVDGGSAVECTLEAPPASWRYPAGPYGNGEVGETFEDFEMRDCDGNPTRFGDILGGAEMVLLNVGAGWCQPCIEETEDIEEAINERFCGRGLRIVQVLFQDQESRPATTLFCQRWRERFGLTFPVLVDPVFEMDRYFEAAQTPLNLLIDRQGVIRLRTQGTVPEDLPNRLDELLPR